MPLQIYLIEDEGATRQALADLLQEIADVQIVGFAENEVHAIHWLSTHDSAWDLAVVDLHLKMGSGMAALRWCATRRPHQKVVVLSSLPSDEARAQCLALGADRVFDKTEGLDKLLVFCQDLSGATLVR